MPRSKRQEIWKHFITIDKSAKCKYCDKLYQVANVNKMERHLLACFKFPTVKKEQIRNSADTRVALTIKTQPNPHTPEGIEIQKGASYLPLSLNYKTFTEEKRKLLDQLISQAIFVTGAPISMFEHPLWSRVFQELQPLYKPPSSKVTITHIDSIYNQMEKEILEDLKSATNLHLQCDGWRNYSVEGMLNFFIAKSDSFFVKSLNTLSLYQTSEYISQEIIKVINVYGAHKFATLIGDNENNIQNAFDLVRNEHPHIIPLRCVAHTLNLLCEDFMKPDSVKGFVKIVIDTIKTILRSQLLSSLLAQIVKEKECGEILTLPVKSRWGTHYTALRSVQKTKEALQTLAVHREAAMDDEHKAHLLDETFWIMIDECIKLLQPIHDKIIQLERNDLHIHNVYLSFKDIESALRDILPDMKILDENDKKIILNAFKVRMNVCIKPLHLAAYLLDPKCEGVKLEEIQEVETFQFLCDEGERMGLDIMDDLSNYTEKKGFWGYPVVWKGVENMSPIVWWKGICGKKPLSKIAVRLLTTPCTAVPEGSLSFLEHIHNAKRNNLTSEEAAKISFIKYNWNVLHKNTMIIEESDDENVTASISTPISKANLNEPSTSRGFSKPIEFLDISATAEEDWDSD